MADDTTATPTRRFKIYTKTGDTGTSSLYNGQRLPKHDLYFQALGDVDELNCALGVAREAGKASTWREGRDEDMAKLMAQLENVQCRLFDMGSAIATPQSSSSKAKVERTQFAHQHVAVLEAWIDTMDACLPPLKNFILPSGGYFAALLHQARATCRRAERSVVRLAANDSDDVAVDLDPQVLVYLNRLSDYLFTAARFAASATEGAAETIWTKQ